MEFINNIQLLILTLIIGLLFFQMVAKKKGMFIEVKYSDKQRLAIALGIAAIPLIWGLLTEQYFMFCYCYRNEYYLLPKKDVVQTQVAVANKALLSFAGAHCNANTCAASPL